MTSERDDQETAAASKIFECKMCGECCNGFGGTVVTETDIQNISEYIGTDPRHFVDDYCQMSGDKTVLAQGENGYCIFWDGLCTIHPVKPRMCRAWPFIQSVLVDVSNWHIMAGFCPGMRTDVSEACIRACVEKALIEEHPAASCGECSA